MPTPANLQNTVPESFADLIDAILDEDMDIVTSQQRQLKREIIKEVAQKFFVLEIPELAPEVVEVRDNKLWLDGEPASRHFDGVAEHWLEIHIPNAWRDLKQAVVKYVRAKEIYVALRQIKADEDYRREQIEVEVKNILRDANLFDTWRTGGVDMIITELAERRVDDHERKNNGS